MKIIICGSEAYSVVQFRGDLIKSLIKKKHDVVIVVNNITLEHEREFTYLGARSISIPITRHSYNPFKELKLIYRLAKIFCKERPDYVLSYTIKPVIWSGIVLHFFPKIKFSAMITGLGAVFNSSGFMSGIIERLFSRLYRLALKKSEKVIFQNNDNKNKFHELKIVKQKNSLVVNGSGVNINHFSYYKKLELKDDKIVFLMAARLLKDKGIGEYLQAAKSIKKAYKDKVEFRLLGHEENSHNSFSIKEIKAMHKDKTIIYGGFVTDIRNSLINSSVFVLPSYHEGMPRSVLEAMAIGRPILTTDTPGCNDTVIDGFNGWLVPKGDGNALERKMAWFLENNNKLEEMGKNSRKMAVDFFDVDVINRQIIDILKL